MQSTENTKPSPIPSVVDVLKDELKMRKKRNPAYSLRSFARFLKISPGKLSEYLSGKRPVGVDTILKLTESLQVTEEEKLRWLRQHNALKLTPKSSQQVKTYVPLPEDQFELISNWHHFAILNLTKLKDFDSNPKAISQRLGIELTDVQTSIALLLRLGMLVEDESLGLRRSCPSWMSKFELPPPALRNFHRSSLELDIDALDRIAIENRDITSIIFPASSQKMKKARKLIRDFQRRLASLMEDEDCDTVYKFGAQLVPLTEETP